MSTLYHEGHLAGSLGLAPTSMDDDYLNGHLAGSEMAL